MPSVFGQLCYDMQLYTNKLKVIKILLAYLPGAMIKSAAVSAAEDHR
jgi:hypothetical protein